MGTAIYTRVSTTKQEEQGVSLETQISKLKSYCDFKDLINIKEYMDVGTGRNTERDGFKQLMKDIEIGKIKNLVVFRLDRLTRSVSDLNTLLKDMDKYDCGLHSATESLDTSTANGRMMVNLIGVLAQWESETISERVTVNMQSLAAKGVWMSVAPYGFYLGDDKQLKIKDDEASMVREACQLVLEGESVSSAERIMNKRYNLNWHNNFLGKKIKQQSTIGNIYRNGEIYQDTHEGIISEETQHKLLKIMNDNKTGRRYLNHNDLFRRRIVCPACDSVMTMAARSTNNYKTTNYSYTCHVCYDAGKGLLSVSEPKIEQALLKHFEDIQISDFKPVEKPDDTKLISRLKSIQQQIDKLQRAWLSDMISDDDLMTYKKELNKEQEEIEKELSSTIDVVDVESVKEMKRYFIDIYNELDREEKRRFIQSHISKIHFNREKVKGTIKTYVINVVGIDFL